MAQYLVTGGAGFIGGHLCRALRAGGHDVVVLDDLSTGTRANLEPDTQLIEGDIRDEQAVANAIQNCDAVIHLAAIASVMRYGVDWQHASSINLGGTIVVFQAAARAGVPVVYASSAAVYGAAADLPLREDALAQPISGYGADKLACELHAAAMAEVDGLISIGLRFFNIYGPGQLRGSDYSGVVTTFLDRWQAGDALCVFGDGAQSRDFIYVADIVRAILAAIEVTGTATGADVLNICSSKPTSITKLITDLASATGHDFEVTHLPARKGEILHSLGDGSRAKSVLGFAPGTAMTDGLRDLSEWFQSNG